MSDLKLRKIFGEEIDEINLYASSFEMAVNFDYDDHLDRMLAHSLIIIA